MEISYIKGLDNRKWDIFLIGRRDLGKLKDLVPVISLVETKPGIIVFHHYHDPIVDAVKNPMESKHKWYTEESEHCKAWSLLQTFL